MEFLSRIVETVLPSTDTQSAEGQRRTAKFRAKDIDRPDNVWFQLLEGEKKGLQFALPIYHEEHSVRIRQALQDAKQGCVYEVTFVADNAKGTKFYCSEIKRLSW